MAVDLALHNPVPVPPRRLRAGERVTLLGPWEPGDPIITEYQYCGRVSRVGDGHVWYESDGAPGYELGPFPARRMRRGWLTPPEARR